MKDRQAQSVHFSHKVGQIITSASGKRILPIYENKNFFVYHNKKDSIEAVYVAHHSECIRDIKWISGTGKQMVTISDKLCYAWTTNSGSWSFASVDIQSDLLPMNFVSSKHLTDRVLMQEYEKA